MRVLVFDDDAAVGRLVARVAVMAGLEPTSITDAESFASQLEADPPDAILLDLQLGPTDGVEQLKLLARRGYGGAVVLMSGFDVRVLGTARAFAESIGLKVVEILEKPLRVAELERVFHTVKSTFGVLTAEHLRSAIANDELILEFQPIVCRYPPQLQKLEALVRWEHPVSGLIAPAQIIEIAERDEATIDALTARVIDGAVEAYHILSRLGVVTPLSVNVSASNLHDLALPDRIGEALRTGGMPAAHLCLELTETAAFTDAIRGMDILSRLRLKGIALSIDNFGSGYSSFKLLRQLPFTEIKIDRSLVTDVHRSTDSRMIVKSIAELAVNLDLACVAKGVECEEAAATVEEVGVKHLQGFLVGRPMPIEGIPVWLATWTGRAIGPVADPAPASVRREQTVPGPGGAAAALSPRQVEVMALLSEGLSVKEIARRLEISISTVKVHLSMAYAALGAHNRIEAINRAGLRHG